MKIRLFGHWRHLKKDGSIIQVEINSHPIDWEGQSARIVMVHDITEVMRIEREHEECHDESLPYPAGKNQD